ncbi:hypothetical protein L1049_018926 [Liquidambar formosana]|uniref:Mechanosensitive ion channel protein Msy1/2-like transmembrane domain-containing protein n=1 Tax=Liquidambar formosana TaxID=63359 RepID=A0AAP0RBQ7_LIQFO
MASPGGVGVDEYEEICKKVNSQLSKEKSKKVKTKVLVEWVAFVCILGCLVASLTVEELLNSMFWGLEMWKWCVLVMVIFCGMLVTNWVMNILVFIIERNFLLRKKVLYFVHGLKKSVQVFIWFALILLTWVLLFNRGVERSANTTKILDFITWTIVSFLIGAFLWLFKTLLLKILASSFHVNTFFDRIQESVFHQYVLQTLSGPPLVMMAERVGRTPSAGQLSFKILKKGKEKKEKKEVIDMAKLHKMKQGKVSSWTMKVMVDAIASSGLSTLSNTLDETVYDGGGEQTDREITSEMEAMAAAYDIFTNVANGSKYIVEDDLLNFMIKEEVDLVFPLFGVAAETGQIDLKCLTDWVDILLLEDVRDELLLSIGICEDKVSWPGNRWCTLALLMDREGQMLGGKHEDLFFCVSLVSMFVSRKALKLSALILAWRKDEILPCLWIMFLVLTVEVFLEAQFHGPAYVQYVTG